MADGDNIFLNLANQKNAISNITKKILRNGDTWCLIATEWFVHWKKFVSFDSSETSRFSHQASCPGPIDNSPVLDENGIDIKSDLSGERDYVLLPQEGWDLLYEWYGIADKQKPIYRKVIEYGLNEKYCMVEVYLLELKLSLINNTKHFVVKKFSKADTIGFVEDEMKKIFKIPADRKTRLWFKLPTGRFERIDNDNQKNTIRDVGLDYPDPILLIEQSNEDGSYPGQLGKFVKPETTRLANNHGSTSSENTFMCKICLELKALVAFIPCGHSLACPACAEKLKACPLCRGLIQSEVRLYFG